MAMTVPLAVIAAQSTTACSTDPSYDGVCAKLSDQVRGADILKVRCGGRSETNSQYRHWLNVSVSVRPGEVDQGRAEAIEKQALTIVWTTPVDTAAVSVEIETRDDDAPGPAAQPDVVRSAPLGSALIPLFETNGNFSSLAMKTIYDDLRKQFGPHPRR